jgi:hypothetical protein
MTYDKAKEFLKDYLDENGNLHYSDFGIISGADNSFALGERWISWAPGSDGDFTAEELEAFATYIKNNSTLPEGTPRGK